MFQDACVFCVNWISSMTVMHYCRCIFFKMTTYRHGNHCAEDRCQHGNKHQRNGNAPAHSQHFQQGREKKIMSVPLTAAVLKNFSELASDTWKKRRMEWAKYHLDRSMGCNIVFQQNIWTHSLRVFAGMVHSNWEGIIGKHSKKCYSA